MAPIEAKAAIAETDEEIALAVRQILEELLWKVTVAGIKVEDVLDEENSAGTNTNTSTYPATESVVNIKAEAVEDIRGDAHSDVEEVDSLHFSADDSEEEFNNILSYAAKELEEVHMVEYGKKPQPANRRRNTRKEPAQHEYDKMGSVQTVCISLRPETEMKKLGKVVSIIDKLVCVASDGANAIALDFDSILFDKQKKVIGQVYDVMGNVREPWYCVRFNTQEEAQKWAVGTEVFIAANDEECTRLVLVDQLSRMKIVDEQDGDVSGEDSEDETKLNEQGQKGNRKRPRDFEENRGRGRGRGQPRGSGGGQRGGRGAPRGQWPPGGHGNFRQQDQHPRWRGAPPQHFKATEPTYSYSADGGFYEDFAPEMETGK